MMADRLRRRVNIKPESGQCVVFVGNETNPDSSNCLLYT